MVRNKQTPREIKECRKHMATILARPSLFVTSQRLEYTYQRYYFASEDSSMAEAGDRAYSVVPFFDTGVTKYWVGVSIDVTEGRKPHLRSVSLVVFEGEAGNMTKIPAFRAEWDCFDPSDHKHAQPHWHVYSVVDQSVQVMDGVFEPEPRLKEFKPNTLNPSRQFHFAMGSQWHLDADSHMCLLDLDNLCKWLGGCVNYIRGQFDYLYSS